MKPKWIECQIKMKEGFGIRVYDDYKIARKQVTVAKQNGQDVTKPFRLIRPDGSRIWGFQVR